MAKKVLPTAALAMALLFAFSAVAAAAVPSVIYYTNAEGKVVQADYRQAVVLAVAGNTALLDALKAALREAQDNFRAIVVKNDDGSVVDWQKALADRKSYPEAMADSRYAGTEPAHQLVLALDESGRAAEKAAWPVEMEGLPVVSYSEITQKTYATITIKPEYVDRVTAVTIAGNPAVQLSDRSKWRAEVPEGTTAESLAGRIVITVQEPGQVEAIKEIRAKIDFLGQTRVWVYLNEGIEAASVTANGRELQYNAAAQRWEGVFDDLRAGDTVQVVVTTASGERDEGSATVVAM